MMLSDQVGILTPIQSLFEGLSTVGLLTVNSSKGRPDVKHFFFCNWFHYS